MKTEKTEKTVYFKDDFNLKMVDDGIKKTFQVLQDIVDQWEKVSPVHLTINELLTFIDNLRRPIPEKVLRSIQLKKAKRSPLFDELDIESVIKMQKTTDIGPLLESIGKLSEYIPFAQWNNVFSPQCFAVDGNTVKIIESEVETLRRRFYEFAETPVEQKRLKYVQSVIDSINDLVNEYPEVNVGKCIITGLVTIPVSGDKLCPSPQFIKTGRLSGPVVTGDSEVMETIKEENLQTH